MKRKSKILVVALVGLFASVTAIFAEMTLVYSNGSYNTGYVNNGDGTYDVHRWTDGNAGSPFESTTMSASNASSDVNTLLDNGWSFEEYEDYEW